MDNTEMLVTEEVAENVEQTTEETVATEQAPAPKTYTQEEVDAIVGKSKARAQAKIRKEYERKYGDLEEVLRAGTGKQDVDEMTSTFRDFYSKKGVQMPTKPTYSDHDTEVLARDDAEEIIRAGYDDVVEEVDRLTKIGAANMNPRERAVFKRLAEHRQSEERTRELAQIGVKEDVYKSPEFTAFASKFNTNTPVGEIYDLFKTTQPKSKAEPIGSMKNGSQQEAKTYYSPEDVDKLKPSDYDNPVVMKNIRESMKKWK